MIEDITCLSAARMGSPADRGRELMRYCGHDVGRVIESLLRGIRFASPVAMNRNDFVKRHSIEQLRAGRTTGVEV